MVKTYHLDVYESLYRMDVWIIPLSPIKRNPIPIKSIERQT